MSILQLIIVLVVIGFILWLFNTYLPMDVKTKKIINVVVIILVILWLLNVTGVFGSQLNMHMGNWHMGNLHVR